MNMSVSNNIDNSSNVASWSFRAAVAALILLAATEAGAQSWEYQAYQSRTSNSSGAAAGDRTALGYITVEDKGRKAVFRMVAGRLDSCYSRDIDATVIKTEATTTITLVPSLRGCEEVRFVIKNDGTGGQRETKKGSDWVWDGFDRGLTPRK